MKHLTHISDLGVEGVKSVAASAGVGDAISLGGL